MKDEKLYTQFGSIRSSFLATPIFNFLTLGGSLVWTGWGIFVKYVSKNLKFNNLSKTGSFVKIFQQEPRNIIILVKKVVKNRRFRHFFQLKHDITLRKYNCYMLRIKTLKKIIWSWWGDIRVTTWDFEDSQESQLIKGMLKTFHIAIKLSKNSF